MPKRATRRTEVFIDGINDQVVRILVGKRGVNVPLELLPEGIREGMWVELVTTELHDKTQKMKLHVEERLRQLTRDDDDGDDGGDLDL